MTRHFLASVLLVSAAGACHAAPFFSDNFDTANLTSRMQPNTAPAGWTIGNTGTVDIYTGVFGGVTCKGSVGSCIDLDGSSGRVGLLQRSFALVGGQTYTASFDLAGGNGTSLNSVAVNFGTASLALNNLAGGFVYNSYSLQFTPTTSGNYTLSFLNNGGTTSDNFGASLDNVNITVPEPGTLAIVALALGALALSRRKAR